MVILVGIKIFGVYWADYFYIIVRFDGCGLTEGTRSRTRFNKYYKCKLDDIFRNKNFI